MCIIAYVPANKTISDDTIKYMYSGNPDGAGIMWMPKDGSQIEIRKGFMSVKSLLKAWHKLPDDIDRAIHCRIATSGVVSQACCHPFPIRPKVMTMRNPVDREDAVLMHNGIIDYCTPLGGMKAEYSDSMQFATYLYKYRKHLSDKEFQDIIENSSYSRLLIFRKGREPIMLGDWKEEDGVYYSNGNYKYSPTIKKGCSGSIYNWGYGYSIEDEKDLFKSLYSGDPNVVKYDDYKKLYPNNARCEAGITVDVRGCKEMEQAKDEIMTALAEIDVEVYDIYSYLDLGVEDDLVYVEVTNLNEKLSTIAGYPVKCIDVFPY